MIWLFGASLLHLSIAARNELKVKTVLKFILFGVVYTFIVVVFELIRYTIVFGIMVQSVMNQLNFFVVLYIAKKKFLPAMNSRIIDTVPSPQHCSISETGEIVETVQDTYLCFTLYLWTSSFLKIWFSSTFSWLFILWIIWNQYVGHITISNRKKCDA